MKFLAWLTEHVRGLLLLVGGLCVLGGLLAFRLPVAIFPTLAIPRIIVAAEGSDAPSQNVLVGVTRPLEEAFSGVPGLTLVQSQTTRGSAGFTLTFQDGTDMDKTLQLVQAQIGGVRSTLPAGMTVTAERLNPTVFPILDYSITSPSRSLADLKKLAITTMRPRIARVPGVARVLINGGETREFQLIASPDRLAAVGASLQQLTDAIAKTNEVTAVGSYDQDYLHHLVIVSGVLTDADSIRRTVVSIKNRVPITVANVAEVREGIERKTVIATGGGHEAVLMNIVRRPDGNTVEVADQVRAELAAMKSVLPSDVSIRPFYDQSEIVRESQSSVVEAIAIGTILALGVVAFSLRNFRAALITILMLPLTLLITFVALWLLGMTLNIMTLGAIAIALGLVIDDAIVVVEHMYLGLEHGLSKFQAIAEGLWEITPAMVGSSLATIVTFAPLMLLPGVTGGFFAPLALTLIAMLVVSLALALTIVPVMARYILPDRIERTEKREGFLVRCYRSVIANSLRYRAAPLLAVIPLAVLVWFVYGRLQTGFMPEFDEGAFVIDYRMPDGTSLGETDRVMKQVEAILAHTEGVSNWSRLTGAQSGSGLEITSLNQGDILVRLSRGNRPPEDEIVKDVRKKILTVVPNVDIDIAAILGDLIGDIAGSPAPIQVKVFGPDVNKLKDLAEDVGKRVSSVKGVVDMEDGVIESGPETMVNVDPIQAGEHGFTVDDVSTASETALDGTVATTIKKGDLLESVRVMYPYRVNRTDADLANLPIPNSSGQLVALGSVSNLLVDPGSPELDRENQRLMFSVTARLEGIDLGTGIQAVKAKMKDLALPPGYSIEYGGLYKSQQESFKALGTVLATAAASVFAVMVFALRSFRIAFSLFLAALLSLSGVVTALWITKTPLNISSYTGAIMIVGIVTENGILLFDEYRRRARAQPDTPPIQLLEEAGAARLRPILMTTCAAITALLPLAIGLGAGAAMQQPLAIAVIGGLAFSTFFTLVLAPVIYATLLGRRLRAAPLVEI